MSIYRFIKVVYADYYGKLNFVFWIQAVIILEV